MKADQFIEGVMQGLSLFGQKATTSIRGEVARTGYKLKRKVFQSAIEITFAVVGIICLSIGIILFLTRFMSLEASFILIGFLLIYVVLIISKFK